MEPLILFGKRYKHNKNQDIMQAMLSCGRCYHHGAVHSPQQGLWQKLQLPAARYCSKQAPSDVLTPLASHVQSPHFVPIHTQVEEGAHEHLEPSHNPVF